MPTGRRGSATKNATDLLKGSFGMTTTNSAQPCTLGVIRSLLLHQNS